MSDRVGLNSSRRSVARGTALNILGLGLPMGVAVVATPILIHRLGAERYGVLTVAWGLIGYFTLLDLGLGRALTKGVAERLGTPREGEIPAVAWTGVYMMMGLGLLGALLALASIPWVAGGGLQIDAGLRGEAVDALVLLALSLPFVISTTGLRCVLEGYGRFGAVNALRIPMGVFTFAGPLLVLPFTRALGPVVAMLVLGRLAGWVAHLVVMARVPGMGASRAPSRRYTREMLSFGGWMTASAVSSTLMSYVDRFVIGATISMAAVAYFATPFDMLQRISMLPGALVSALFPVVASGLREGSGADGAERTAAVFGWSVRSLLVTTAPVVLVLVTLAHEALRLWLGAAFALHGTPVLRWVALGMLLNTLGMVGAAVVQAGGRPDLTGKLNLLELPAYLLVLGWLLRVRGIEGAAIAWTLRVGVDALVLMVVAARMAPAVSAGVRTAGAWTAGVAVLCGIGAALPSTGARVAYLCAALPIFVLAAWRGLLLDTERRTLARLLASSWLVFNPRAKG